MGGSRGGSFIWGGSWGGHLADLEAEDLLEVRGPFKRVLQSPIGGYWGGSLTEVGFGGVPHYGGVPGGVLHSGGVPGGSPC